MTCSVHTMIELGHVHALIKQSMCNIFLHQFYIQDNNTYTSIIYDIPVIIELLV